MTPCNFDLELLAFECGRNSKERFKFHICPLKLFSRDLLATVKKLQDENRKLASSLAAAHEQSRDSAFSEDGEEWFTEFQLESFSQLCFQRHILR